MEIGEYHEFAVTPESVGEFVPKFIQNAKAAESGAAFAQLGVGGCACGTEVLCVTRPSFQFRIRLDWILKLAADLATIANGYHVEHEEDRNRWLVTFYSESDPIAGALYRILRDICGCDDGDTTDAYLVDPQHWDAEAWDAERQRRIAAANETQNPPERLYEYLERLSEAGIRHRLDFTEEGLEVQVSAPGERYEFLFLPAGDVIYTRYQLSNNLVTTFEEMGAGILDELIGLYGYPGDGTLVDDEKIAERLSSTFGGLYQDVHVALHRHDPLQLKADAELTEEGVENVYLLVMRDLLPEMRYAVTQEGMRSLVEESLQNYSAWGEPGTDGSNLSEDVWQAWIRHTQHEDQ